MKLRFSPQSLAVLVTASVAAMLATMHAYPPAPHHTIYGMVRNDLGEPLDISGSEVILETDGSDAVSTMMIPGLQPGINYQMNVPMDSGITSDLYKPTAMRPFLPFRLKVKIGQVTYLPIEMSGNFLQMGLPGKSTRIDLTLGEDSDGDGLPDAWEEALIAALGGGLTIADIDPSGDADGDGLSNLDEYLAGTYAFEPNDGFRLEIVGGSSQGSTLEFLSVQGRDYSIQASLDLKTWVPITFRTEADGPFVDSYLAGDSRVVQIEIPIVSGGATNAFFRAMVQ